MRNEYGLRRYRTRTRTAAGTAPSQCRFGEFREHIKVRGTRLEQRPDAWRGVTRAEDVKAVLVPVSPSRCHRLPGVGALDHAERGLQGNMGIRSHEVMSFMLENMESKFAVRQPATLNHHNLELEHWYL
jgi:hypothetical protein